MFIEDLLCVDTEQSDVQITKNSYETEFLAKKTAVVNRWEINENSFWGQMFGRNEHKDKITLQFS